MILRCQFNGYETDFVKTISFDYGYCFTFNSGFDSFSNKIPIKTISLLMELLLKLTDPH